MFPLNWNIPFIKKNGKRTTIGAELENAGTPYTLPTASASTKGGVKIGSGLVMTGDVLSTESSGGGTPYTDLTKTPIKLTSSSSALTLTNDAIVYVVNSGSNYLGLVINDEINYNVPDSSSAVVILPAGTKVSAGNSAVKATVAYLS